ncbi:Conserved_hypothetical protein [Hexamita inflata]|uniref:Transmembrane protein n=1 Tax=Hexamita inflata TaxID=28002 RepID=A0ABP1HUG0_9EUKA
MKRIQYKFQMTHHNILCVYFNKIISLMTIPQTIQIYSVLQLNLVQKGSSAPSYPPTLQQAINGILKDPQKFQTQNYTSIRENRQIFFQYSVNLSVKLKVLQSALQDNGLQFKNFQAVVDNVLPTMNDQNLNLHYYPQTDLQKYQLVFNLSETQNGTWDPIIELNKIVQDSNYVNGEQVIISDADSNTYSYPFNPQNKEFDGTGLLFGLVYSKLEQVIFYVDVTFNFNSNLNHFFTVLELMNPYCKMKVYSVENKVELVFEGQVNDVRVKYLRDKFVQRDKFENTVRGELLIAHMKKIQTTLKTHIFVFSQGIEYQETLNYSFLQIKITVVNTKSWQVQHTTKNYFQSYHKIKQQAKTTVYKFQNAIGADLIDLYNQTLEMKTQLDYIRLFRSKIFQILTPYLNTDVQYSPLIESQASTGMQQVIFLVLPIIQNNLAVGIVATSFSLQTIQEMIISQAPEYFTSNLFSDTTKNYNNNGITKLTPGELRLKVKQANNLKYNSTFQKIYSINRNQKSFQPNIDNIYLNLMTILQLKKLQNGTVQNKQTIPMYNKGTLQFDPNNNYIFSVNQTYSEPKYLFSNQQKNESVQLLYIGQQCYVDDYKLLFEIKYNEHELLNYDNCTYFKQITNMTKCLCEFDNQLQLKLPFQSLQFIQNSKILNPYILEKFGIFDNLKKVTIRELLGLTECSENVNGQINEYMFVIPGTEISMKITQQFMFYIRMWRYMNLLTQVYSQSVSPERMCIFSHFNQMRLCTMYQFQNNIEVLDQTKLKYQQFEFANKHWLVPHSDDEFPSTCHESWLFQSKQSVSKDIFANSYEFSESFISYSMYSTYQGQVTLSPVSEPYSYSPYLYIQNNIDKNQLELSTFSSDIYGDFEYLYLDSAGFILSSTQQHSKGKNTKIINEFDIFDSQLCQLSQQSQVLLDALFVAGLVKISYSISSGQVCTRYELLVNGTKQFSINQVKYEITNAKNSHIYYLFTEDATKMKIFSHRQDQLCFTSMQKYNEYLQKHFKEKQFKFQISGKNYSITDDYNLSYSTSYYEFSIREQQHITNYSSLTKIVFILLVIFVIYFVAQNSFWIR